MKVATAKAADLRVAERLPERAAVHREREQREYGGADGDHHRAKADDAGVDDAPLRMARLSRAFLR